MGPTGPALGTKLAGDHAHQAPAVCRRQKGNVVSFEPLVGGWNHLVLRWQVHPELDAVEQATADNELLRWSLQDASTCGHPLRGTIGDETTTTLGVLVSEGSVDHVGHRLEPAVRVPGGSLRLTRRIVDLTHLVHVDKGV